MTTTFTIDQKASLSSPATTDVLPILDVSATQLKKVTVGDLITTSLAENTNRTIDGINDFTKRIDADAGVSFDDGTNTLDEYEEGTFNPTFNLAIVGDLSVAYDTQDGFYTRIGNRVMFDLYLVCTPTFTTASGRIEIESLPFTEASNSTVAISDMALIGLPATYTQFGGRITGSRVVMQAIKDDGSTSTVDASELTSGVEVFIRFSGQYRI